MILPVSDSKTQTMPPRPRLLDPPYNVKVESVVGRGRTKHREFAMASGEMARQDYVGFLIETLGNARHAFSCSIARRARSHPALAAILLSASIRARFCASLRIVLRSVST